jgi:hypothetical protein
VRRPGPAIVAVALLSLAGAADRAGAGRQAVDGVQDLAYGEVLFHFYQEDYFNALIRLAAAEARSEIPSHRAEAELLLGGLHLSYGQHQLAGAIFERVLARSVEPGVHDRAWYFLAKVWYQRGYLGEAERAVARITAPLPPELEPERRMLEAQLLMDSGRFDAALATLESWRRPGETWAGFAQYNIGVALVRLGRVEDGARLLEQVGLPPQGARRQRATNDDNRVALRDRANLALGYAWLQASRPEEAAGPLSRVQLSGPYSNKALLGMGWAEAERGEYRAALAPWLELGERNLLDAAVQESMLAIPFAYAQLGAYGQAVDRYVDALDAFDAEIARLDESIAAIRRGELVTALLAERSAVSSGWYFRLESLPDRPETRYLYELMASHRFQEGLKNYRDVLGLTSNLEEWLASLAVFDDILDTRERAFRERLPRLEATLARVDPDAAAAHRVALEGRIAVIERDRAAAALGTRSERELLAELDAMDARVARLGSDPESVDLRERHRLLKGMLLWDLDRDFPARLWQTTRSLRDLDREIREAQRRRYRVESFRDEWPETFAVLSARIAELTPRVVDLRTLADITLARQGRFLEDVAVTELTGQRERLESYRGEARFALAAIYDLATAHAVPAAGADVSGTRR